MENIFECPICLNGYNLDDRLPRQLDCQHTLCSQCLSNINRYANSPNAYVECPICKGKTKKSLKDIPRSLLIVQLMDATKYKADNSNSKLEQSTAPPQPYLIQSESMSPFCNMQQPSISPSNSYIASTINKQ